ncbi:NUDIX hydrolase domain-like protein [Fomitopsis serialis]|uniref:NUDIX hydrolase domain-like protein n=1 Tax=Fomitopsis serialis TaxID=139415 RepID=UPI0020080D87|nr:NUDIX hydrolase domain-like protein [Neoantrodia serialis]KAH9932440.1 NUDIX hydrolase domain-like protein [Neoantrodia serialis]
MFSRLFSQRLRSCGKTMMSSQLTRLQRARLSSLPLRSATSNALIPRLSRSHSNFFGGAPLNRLSWLRQQQSFLNNLVPLPETQWLVFHDGRPLVSTERGSKAPALARLSTADVRSLLGPEPFFGQGQTVGGQAAASDVVALEGARLRGPPIVFLGLQEPPSSERRALPSSEFIAKGESGLTDVFANIEGSAYFSLNVTDIDQHTLDAALQNSAAGKRGAQLAFVDPRSAMGALDYTSANIFAMARSMHDWNSRNKYCPSCGSPSYSQWAGWKLGCSSLLPWAQQTEGKKPCVTAQGLHNFSHPRTDMVVIAATVDPEREKILLGRNKRFPPGLWSVLSGFIEPGESLEDAVKRETWEEAGLEVQDVQYHSSQPWPYPATLMAGLYAVADSSKPTRTDLDNELEDVRWYSREYILNILEKYGATHPSMERERSPDAPMSFPDTNAIGGVLISEWAYGKAGQDG